MVANQKLPRAKQITVWLCGHGHNHRSLTAAELCIAKSSPGTRRQNTQRNRTIILMRLDGATYKTIGVHFNLSASRIPQIYNLEMRRLRHPRTYWFRNFSDEEKDVATGKVPEPDILKGLFLRMWEMIDTEREVQK